MNGSHQEFSPQPPHTPQPFLQQAFPAPGYSAYPAQFNNTQPQAYLQPSSPETMYVERDQFETEIM